MYLISVELFFPPVSEANSDGILAVGGDLSPERLLLAYKSGIFPWFEGDEPILWWALRINFMGQKAMGSSIFLRI